MIIAYVKLPNDDSIYIVPQSKDICFVKDVYNSSKESIGGFDYSLQDNTNRLIRTVTDENIGYFDFEYFIDWAHDCSRLSEQWINKMAKEMTANLNYFGHIVDIFNNKIHHEVVSDQKIDSIKILRNKLRDSIDNYIEAVTDLAINWLTKE